MSTLTTPKSRHAAARTRRHSAERLSRESLLERAAFLPPLPRALVSAYFGLGMSIDEMALLHGLTRRQLRRRLDQLKQTLSDPCFIIAAHFADHLPPDFASLAKAHWLEAATLRDLAETRGQTLHRIRHDLVVTRSLLVLAMASQQQVPVALALAAMDGHPVN